VSTEKVLKGFADLDRIFEPKSIAIVGVSSEGFGFGRGILLSHLAIGYEGKLYPVNKRGGSIEGMTIYPSIESIPDKIDFAIIAVPAHLVPSALEACRIKGAVGAEVLSSGFSETGTPEGIALEEELRTVAEIGANHAARTGPFAKTGRSGAAFTKRRPFSRFWLYGKMEGNKLLKSRQLRKRLRSQGNGDASLSPS
jgi:hypothetical protein